jgi:hypothetical protein
MESILDGYNLQSVDVATVDIEAASTRFYSLPRLRFCDAFRGWTWRSITTSLPRDVTPRS